MKQLIKSIAILVGLISVSSADVLECKGVEYGQVVNGKTGARVDASKLSIRVNTTNEKAVVILNNAVSTYNFIKEMEHPSGHKMLAYNDGVSEEFFYIKKTKTVLLKKYEGTTEMIITFQCKDKEYPQK